MNSTLVGESQDWEPKFTGLLFLVVVIIGVFGNVLSLHVFTRKKLHSSINVLLAGLSAIDLTLCILVIPVFVLPLLLPYKFLFEWAIQSYALVYFYPLNMIAQTSSVWTMVIITIERWTAVVKPLKVKVLCTTKRACKALLIVLIGSLLYNLIRFWEYELVTYTNNNGITMTFHDSLLKNNPVYLLVYYIILYLIFLFAFPFTLILVLNIQIIYVLIKSAKTRTQITSIARHRKENNQPGFAGSSVNDYRTTIMMILIIFSFLVCNTLPPVLNYIDAMNPKFFTSPSTKYYAYLFNDLSNFLILFNSATTFIFYFFFCSAYRNYCCKCISGNRSQRDVAAKTLQKKYSYYSSRVHRKKGSTTPQLSSCSSALHLQQKETEFIVCTTHSTQHVPV